MAAPSVDLSDKALANVVYTEGSFTNARKQKLFTVSYLPGGNALVKAVVVFHHGLKEHVGRHDKEFKLLASSGFAVFSFDAHSHGKSDPEEREMIWSFNHLVDDLCTFTSDVAKQFPGKPLFAAGNSMGALLSALAAQRDQTPYSGIIMFAAAIDVNWTLVLRILAPIGNLLALLIPKAKVAPAVRMEDMSQDPAVCEAIKKDPLCAKGNVRARTANELKKAMECVRRKPHLLTLPILALHGTIDRTTSREAVARFLKNVQSKDVTMIDIKGAYHELTHGPEKEEVLGHVLKWLDAHC